MSQEQKPTKAQRQLLIWSTQKTLNDLRFELETSKNPRRLAQLEDQIKDLRAILKNLQEKK